LIREQRALADIEAGRIGEAIDKCRNIWASLPGAGYNQPEHSKKTLLAKFVALGGVLA
jgi:muramidase (phage lysozyme)